MATIRNGKTDMTAYDAVRYLYDNMPVYNMMKGTYAGVQMVLNMMGLCASVTELWSTTSDAAITNFEGDGLYRADYLDAVRQRIGDWGSANLNGCFLTSRFDIDIMRENQLDFKSFNAMSKTVVSTVEQMKPVSRCLRALYYTIKVDAPVHLEYIAAVGKHASTGPTDPDEDQNARLRNYRYEWDLSGNPLSYKSQIDIANGNIYSLFVPWLSVRAATVIENKKDMNTLKNSYFNLFDLGRKFQISGQNTFRFKLEAYSTDPGIISGDAFTREFTLEIGKEVNIFTETNGFRLEFSDNAVSLMKEFIEQLDAVFVDETDDNILADEGDSIVLIPENAAVSDGGDSIDYSKIGIKLTSVFSTVLGSKYLYQDDDLSLNFSFVEQGWTTQNIPATGYEITHDFDDGEGPVPAIPTDSAGIRNDITKIIAFPVNTDNCGVRNDITGITSYPVNTDGCSVRNDIISIEQV